MTPSGWLHLRASDHALCGACGAPSPGCRERGLPETLNYVVWALTMIPPAVWACAGGTPARDRRSMVLGLAIGLLGAGGQMLLFHAVTSGRRT